MNICSDMKKEDKNMETGKKLELLEEMLELDAGVLQPDMELADIVEWDSMASLMFIVLMDEQFGKSINGEDIKKLATIQDVLDIME